jgi:hypothetical protein
LSDLTQSEDVSALFYANPSAILRGLSDLQGHLDQATDDMKTWHILSMLNAFNQLSSTCKNQWIENPTTQRLGTDWTGLDVFDSVQ